MMTMDRRRKADIRAYQAATGATYLVASRHIAAMDEVMREHPRLSSFGIGVFQPWLKTAGQRRAELAVGRDELAASVVKVMETAVWLRDSITPIRTPTAGSYGVKHAMEQATGRYVTNGVFIAAALIGGYTFRYDQPNVMFGMSARDLNRISS